MRSSGRKPAKELKKGRKFVTMPLEMAKIIEQEALERGVSDSEIIRQCIYYALRIDVKHYMIDFNL